MLRAVERARGERWEGLTMRHGDWGRDAALWLGRRQGRLKLAELGRLAGDLDYAAAGQAVSRFGRRLEKDAGLRREVRQIESELSNVEM